MIDEVPQHNVSKTACRCSMGSLSLHTVKWVAVVTKEDSMQKPSLFNR